MVRETRPADPGQDRQKSQASTSSSTRSPCSGGNGSHGGAPGGGGKPALPRDAAGSVFTDLPPAGAARTVSAVLGEVVWLLTQSPQHKQAFFLGDLEWMAMPPILLQQFRMFYAKDRPLA